jgi:hypothetical protein
MGSAIITTVALALALLLQCESNLAGTSTAPHIMFMVVDGEQTADSTGSTPFLRDNAR